MKPATTDVPLCFDLDNTLVRTNTLAETIVGTLRQHPAWIFLLPVWAIRGQAYLWATLVERFRPDASFLPYSEPVLDFARREAASGHPMVLATGAHQRMAQDVADHVGLFSVVFATSGTVHLVNRRKADILTASFGVKGFDYVGDSWHDMAAFRSCRTAYVVSSSPRLAERLKRESIEAIWIRPDTRVRWWSGMLSAVRPKQWAKNMLVFVPVLLGHRFTDGAALLGSAFAFVLLCLASSSAYLLNDIMDVEADRRHHTKRRRPFARGAVSIQSGVLVGVACAALAVGMGWLAGPRVSALLALYLAGTVLYSVWLKRLLMVDMILLASFYVIRVFLGSAATGIRISSWTALFCLFVFSGLAAVKRYAEVYNRAAQSSDFVNRRAYTPEDAMPLLSIGSSAFVGAIIALGLYLGSPEVRALYRRPDLLWLLCPILLWWTGRLWILGHRGELRDEDPVAFALRDRWSHGAALVSALIFALAL
jgi:4-hydroxybenzoate polyprenyltransferase